MRANEVVFQELTSPVAILNKGIQKASSFRIEIFELCSVCGARFGIGYLGAAMGMYWLMSERTTPTMISRRTIWISGIRVIPRVLIPYRLRGARLKKRERKMNASPALF
jgi:hypothetical protein